MAQVLAALGLLAAVAAPCGSAAVTLGQIDTFEDGTTQGWIINLLGSGGAVTGPMNLPDGGPGGPGDNFLLLSSLGGEVAGGRMTALNPAQWSGDYIAAGVTGIAMDVRNLGQSDLALRLLFEDPGAGPPDNIAISTDAFPLPSNGKWTHVVFPIAPGDLTALEGTVESALTGTTILRLFSNSTPDFPPDPMQAQLGVDNILAVPEPGVALLLAAGLAGIAMRRRR